MPHFAERLTRWSLLIAAVLLVSCGGGQDASQGRNGERAKARALAAGGDGESGSMAFTPTNPIPAGAHITGMFSGVVSWPLIPLHTVLLPDGRLLSYGTSPTGVQTGSHYDLWDPAGGLTGGHTTLDNSGGTDLFCSSQLVLPDGSSVFIAGGDTALVPDNNHNNNTNLISLTSPNAITRTGDMNRARWYSTSITLLNGETYIQGGLSGQDMPEVRTTAGSFRALTGVNTNGLDATFPRNFVAPDGRVFGYDSAGKMYVINPANAGSITMLSTALNSANSGSDASAAMFRPGQILQFGGNSNGAVVIDIRGASPTVTATSSMSKQRRLGTATVLADGKVLATGGSRTWNEVDNVSYDAEIWNPTTGTWTLGATYQKMRLYHSMAILLPDATVLVGGGGAPGPQLNLNAELFFPPYLFTASGTLAARPNITSAPTVLDIGKTFTVNTTGLGAGSRVALVKTGSVTHGFNMEQRFVDLTFVNNAGVLSVQAPARAADTPPGFYMLFVLDAAGVPSVAKILRMNVASDPTPAITPVLTNPGDQDTEANATVSLQLAGTDPNGDALTYAATGLPVGLSLNPAAGLISGSPTAPGNYNVVVSVSDGVNSDSKNFVWHVLPASGNLQVSLAAPTATTSGSTATFSASTSNGVNTQYKWNFGDGNSTGFSASPSATHTYAQSGLYYVSVTAIDARGVEVTVTVLQTIYLPATAGKPVASSNLLLEQPATGNARLWVVNQDNDTVSVFDAVTRAKLKEIAVGAAPRALTRAANGMVWVSNKLTGSVSVLDPATLALSRTLTLPRGAQPFGIVASRNGHVLVVLEGSGQVLKFDSASYAQTGSLAVGTNPRHITLAGDASTAYVSRYITPPMAGESTTAVGAGAAEVIKLNTSAMAQLGAAITLAHSERPDEENQGRGIPNYLGAAVVSPDGTQAFVPSKQDNVKRGQSRDTVPLNFQNTVRAVSSRLLLAGNSEDLAARIDHDNASVASAVAFDARGVLLFVALETSREVAILDAHSRRQIMRIEVGRAPQGLAVAADNGTLYVSNFMDRTVSAYDLRPLVNEGSLSVPLLGDMATVATEKLAASVLKGKQFFYDARDTRLARDRYMSCASCHNDGGHDGRVWDLGSMGEGLRNTTSLRGRAGGQGFLHWSNNFDEVQDFEGQIRNLAGGTGLMADAVFFEGDRSQPLGAKKAGLSSDLDALAAYVGSLNAFAPSPLRPSASALSSAAAAGKAVFTNSNCAACHAGTAFTGSGEATAIDVGTVKPSSGQRLGGLLSGIDAPSLRDVWATAPYLHDGSAPTLEAAVLAHTRGVSLPNGTDLPNLVAYLREIGSDEVSAPTPTGSGTGLLAAYFNNTTLSGTPVLTRQEAIDFNWKKSPGGSVSVSNFSVRWVGSLLPPATGTYSLRTQSDDAVRVWLNGALVIDNWTSHGLTNNTAANVNLAPGQPAVVRVEFRAGSRNTTIRLLWQTPGNSGYGVAPLTQLKQ